MSHSTNRYSNYRGYYYDGVKPIRYEVEVTITRDGLRIQKPGHITTSLWNISEFSQVNDPFIDSEIRLEKGSDIPEILIIKDLSFVEALKSISPDSKSRFKDTTGRPKWISTIIYLSIAAVVVSITLYMWVLPNMAGFIAKRIPVSWEQRLGRGYKEFFTQSFDVCEQEELHQQVERIQSQLLNTISNSRYKYNITILDFNMVNAFALPGGEIVLFRGLIEKSNRPEELAGVMAHEIQHVEQRHSTKILIKDKSLDIILSAVTGNSSGVGSTLNATKILGSLAYRRDEESSADKQGLEMLMKAEVDPNGLIDFFKIIDKEHGDVPDVFKYVSTHPNTQDRINTLKDMIRQSDFVANKLLPDVDWEKTKMLCSKTKESDDDTIESDEHKQSD